MPKWGIEMTEGTVNSWTAQEGQVVAKGEPLLEVETDKIVNTVESPFAGTLRRIVAVAGEVYPVGSLIAVLASRPRAMRTSRPSSKASGARASRSSRTRSAAPAAAAASAPPASEQLVSPVAARLAESLGIDIAKVPGTGRNGRVMKEDVEAFAAAAAAPADANPVTRVRMSAARAVIARRLLESKQSIPHYRLQRDCLAGALAQHRAAVNRGATTRISVNDLIVRASALALVRHPAVNAQLAGDEVLQFAHADIAIAVATPGGLITPIVRGADLLSVADIAARQRRAGTRAREGKRRCEQISGAHSRSPILGCMAWLLTPSSIHRRWRSWPGAVRERPVVQAGAIVTAPVMTLTLGRPPRGGRAVAAQFLATLVELLEKPAQLQGAARNAGGGRVSC
jgi:pyruvate dehydrogenase E2 component (dihydrolipoamide acetyltransferase)